MNTRGYTLADCEVLGFRFKTASAPARFHFEILARHLENLLFDGGTANVKIIVKRGTDITPFIAIAESIGGEYYKPGVYNDYA